MRILFDEGGTHKYALEKCDPGWALYKWNSGEGVVTKGKYAGQPMKAGWRKMEKYPHDIKHAVHLIAEDNMNERVGDFALRTVIKDITEWMKELEVYAEGVECELGCHCP